MTTGQGDPTSAKLRKRPSARAADRKPARRDGRVRATLLLDEQLDFRLTTIAASLKGDRSTLAAQLIDQGLRRYALDAALRQHHGAGQGEEPPPATGGEESPA